MVLLRSQDLKRYEAPDAVRYELDVTTIKRRTQERETKGYPITPELGQLLEQQQRHQPDAPLLHWLPQAQPDGGICRALRRFVEEANLLSPRTGKLLNLYPYRLRYTLATYLFELGAPIAAIAAALNHKGTREAWTYIKTTAAIADKIAQAVDPVMAPLAQRFLGQAIIDTIPSGCQNLILSAVPHLQQLQPEIGVVGVCKRKQPEDCQRAQPLACYLCPAFAAFKSGPHQELLQAIHSFVEQGKGKVDDSILKQHDDVQIAIQQLLRWLQPTAAIIEPAAVEVKALADTVDSQHPQLLPAPVPTLPLIPEQNRADKQQRAESKRFGRCFMSHVNDLPVNSPSGSNAVQQLVALGRRRFDKRLPGQDFDASVWDISCFLERSHWRERTNLYFTRYQTTDQPLPDFYAAAVKSWIILESRSVTNMKQRATAARCLWEVLLQRYGTEPDAFQWHQLCAEDLSQTELMMVEQWEMSSTTEIMRFVIAMTEFFAARGICRRLYFTPQTPSRQDIRDYTLEGQESSQGKLPSPQVIEGLAKIYRLAHEPNDQLRIAILALLLATGFRIGEVLTLPLDCEVEEVRADQVIYGLRYYREKVRHAENRYDIRYLSPKQAELARHAVHRLRLLTAEVRRQAQVLEQDPSRVTLPGFTGNDRLTAVEIAQACGFKEGSSGQGYVSKLAKAGHFCRYSDEAGNFYFVAKEIEAYLHSERVERLWTLDRKDGTYQMLSETLIIVFKNFFHTEKATNPLLVEPVNHAQISAFMSGKQSTQSVFERFEIRETEDTFCKVTAHQFRRWCATLADEGGAPIEAITRWLGHEHEETTRNHYIHTSSSQRAMRA
jgi:integrase